jgi:hypothetical protein
MKKIVLLLVIFASLYTVHAARILWNDVTLVRTDDDPPLFSLGWSDTKWGAFYFVVYCSYNSGTLTPVQILTGTNGVLYESQEGLIVERGSAQQADSIFASQHNLPPPIGKSTPLTGIGKSNEQTKYIAFELNKWLYSSVDYSDDPPSVAPDMAYGWVAISEDANGKPVAISYAIDLDGGPMIVGGGAWEGPTPEPMSGLLLLFGASLLTLRRRRENGKMVAAAI